MRGRLLSPHDLPLVRPEQGSQAQQQCGVQQHREHCGLVSEGYLGIRAEAYQREKRVQRLVYMKALEEAATVTNKDRPRLKQELIKQFAAAW